MRSERPVPVIGNYRMDVRKINVEDSIFSLSTGYNCKTEYASIAQAAERILGKDEVTSSTLVRSSKSMDTKGFLSFQCPFFMSIIELMN